MKDTFLLSNVNAGLTTILCKEYQISATLRREEGKSPGIPKGNTWSLGYHPELNRSVTFIRSTDNKNRHLHMLCRARAEAI